MVAASNFLPTPAVSRRQLHQRQVTLHAYARDDGLYDLEALMEDVKPEDFRTQSQVFPAGLPVHLMAVRLTIDASMTVTQVQGAMPRTPFPALCPDATQWLQRLVGSHLLKGFRQAVAEHLPPRERCTHLSELLTLLPTLAVQSLLQGKPQDDEPGVEPKRPLKLDGCHAWRSDGPMTLHYLPHWYTGGGLTSTEASGAPRPDRSSTPNQASRKSDSGA